MDNSLPKESFRTSDEPDGSTFDKFKHAVADKLHSAAGSLQHDASRQGSQSYRWQAAELLDRSASYVRELDADRLKRDTDRLKRDIEREVRSNTGRSLLIAAAAGLLVGIVLARR